MAQQQKTDSKEAFAALTDKQQAFVIALAQGMTATAAYREAFDAENMSDASVRVESCRLKGRPNIALILDSLAAEKVNAATLTLEEHLQELDRLSKRAEVAGNYGAAVQAQQLRGKAIGLYVERSEDVTDRKPEDLIARLAEVSPELAAVMAKDMGLSKGTQH